MDKYRISLCSAVPFFFAVVFQTANALPEVPAIERAVHAVESDGTNANDDPDFVGPYIPIVRTSVDGRIGMSLPDLQNQTGNGYENGLRFYLLSPENVTNSSTISSAFINSDAGATIVYDSLESTAPYDPLMLLDGTGGEPDRSDFYDYDDTYFDDFRSDLDTSSHGHFALCDGSLDSTKSNPRKCDAGDEGGAANDCYDLTVVAHTLEVAEYPHQELNDADGKIEGVSKPEQSYVRLWSTPITVVVTDPKTDQAAIDKVIADTANMTWSKALLARGFEEMMITGDGRVLSARTGIYGRLNGICTDDDGDGTPCEDLDGTAGLQPYVKGKQSCTGTPLTCTKDELQYGWKKDWSLQNPAGYTGAGYLYAEAKHQHPHWAGFVDMVYAYNDGDVCDAAGWTELKPITQAYYDSDVSDYGFAKFPIRDPLNVNIVEESIDENDNLTNHIDFNCATAHSQSTYCGEGQYQDVSYTDPTYGTWDFDGLKMVVDSKLSYPWIDRFGRNIFFTSYGEKLNAPVWDENGEHEKDENGDPIYEDQYEDECVESSCNDGDDLGKFRGYGLMGSWTQGKVVLLDSMLNNIDYGFDMRESAHRWVQLYECEGGSCPFTPTPADAGKAQDVDFSTGWVRMGSGRDIDSTLNSGTQNIPGNMFNTSIIDSLENIFNYIPEMKPVTPRDVVWLVSNGHTTDEVAFDDYLDEHVFINSSMISTLDFYAAKTSLKTERMVLKNGGYFSPDKWVQNAATTLAPVKVPAKGVVTGYGASDGDERLEPAALGGVHGRGLWLDGSMGIDYAIESQTNSSTDWYYSVFLDARQVANNQRIFTFPNGSNVKLNTTEDTTAGTYTFTYTFYDDSDTALTDGSVAYVLSDTVQSAQSWTHFAFQITEPDPVGAADVRLITVYADGLALGEVNVPAADINDFDMLVSGSDFKVGATASSNGFKGWIDDVKVIFDEINPEVACNHAGGTLVGMDYASVDDLKGSSTDNFYQFPARYHRAISETLAGEGKKFYDRYACYHDYSGDYLAHLGNLPSDLDGESASVRDNLLFPEAPLYHDQGRPATTSNDFCLSCHFHNSSDVPELSTAALASTANHQTVRQPMQPFYKMEANLGDYSGATGGLLDLITMDASTDDTDSDTLSNTTEEGATTATDPSAKDSDSDNMDDKNDPKPMLAQPYFEMDADGVADIFWYRSSDGASQNWLMVDNDQDSVVYNPLYAASSGFVPIGLGDFDADGDADVLWRNTTTGQNTVWIMEDGERDSINYINAFLVTNYTFAGLGDFDGDGDHDIWWRNGVTGQNRIWSMEDGVRDEQIYPASAATSLTFSAVGDFNHDGIDDVVWRKSDDTIQVWLMNHTAERGTITYPPSINSAYTIIGAGDFDADNDNDVLIRNTSTGQNTIWEMEDGDRVTQHFLPAFLSGNYAVVAIADYDGDGDEDILWRDSGTGQNRVWEIDDNDRTSQVYPPSAATALSVVQ